ncbi:MAG TPA: hypothetical protein VIT92_11890 [Burkholderiaceae bacterium]
MPHIFSREAIERQARQAFADAGCTPPVNPHEPDTDAHKIWAAEFYRVQSEVSGQKGEVPA